MSHKKLKPTEETYEYLLTFKFRTPLTGSAFARICDDLDEEFGEGYHFVPEPISEGGIQMVRWPGKIDDKAYKTVRFQSAGGGGHCWPRISSNPDETLGEWRTNFSVVLRSRADIPPPVSDDENSLYHRRPCNKQSKVKPFNRRPWTMGLFAKAFDGAPVWTPVEAQKILRAFRPHGWLLTGKISSARSLRTIRG